MLLLLFAIPNWVRLEAINWRLVSGGFEASSQKDLMQCGVDELEARSVVDSKSDVHRRPSKRRTEGEDRDANLVFHGDGVKAGVLDGGRWTAHCRCGSKNSEALTRCASCQWMPMMEVGCRLGLGGGCGGCSWLVRAGEKPAGQRHTTTVRSRRSPNPNSPRLRALPALKLHLHLHLVRKVLVPRHDCPCQAATRAGAGHTWSVSVATVWLLQSTSSSSTASLLRCRLARLAHVLTVSRMFDRVPLAMSVAIAHEMLRCRA